MVDGFICKPCNYKTNRLNNYSRHVKSKKHKKNTNKVSSKNDENNKTKCIHCDKQIHKANKARHDKVCKQRDQNANEKLIANLGKKVQTMKIRIQELEKEKSELEKQVKQNIVREPLTCYDGCGTI